MASDLFESLADLEVPQPPVQFDEQLHERVNRSLVITQMIDLFTGAVPYAALGFGRAALGMIVFTLTGRYEPKQKHRRR
jgi:hypothetical protein